MGGYRDQSGIRPSFMDFYNYTFYTPFLFFTLFDILYLKPHQRMPKVLPSTAK